LLAWLDCTDEEAAERRAVLAAIIQEFALVGPSEGMLRLDGLGTP
jgi:hypothetical protein